MFSPPTGWPPEEAEKSTIFVQKCQKLFLAATKNFFFLVLSFIPLPFPPQKGGTCSIPLGVQKPLPPAEIWLIHLPVADPTPTYGQNPYVPDVKPFLL